MEKIEENEPAFEKARFYLGARVWVFMGFWGFLLVWDFKNSG